MQILSSLPSLLLILLGFGVLIFVHELGHFIAAKWARIRTEAFAIGMGPVLISWRKGVGFAFGSSDRRVAARCGKPALELTDEELERHGIGETEYSLRWFPIGGFVKMLGQEDLRPGAVSDQPRSYNVRPIGRRMVVVCAGVVMNVLLALVLFGWAFLVGVRFEAPVIGEVAPLSPAAMTTPENAAEASVDEPGLKPGDRVVSIDGKEARTFTDIQIATAMSKPGTPVRLAVERAGVDEPLRFVLEPQVGPEDELLSVGVGPGRSTRLLAGPSEDAVNSYLEQIGLAASGVRAGMQLVAVADRPVSTIGEVGPLLNAREGEPVRTRWTALDRQGRPVGEPITAVLPVHPRYQQLLQESPNGKDLTYDVGLFGLTPLIQIQAVSDKSANRDRLRAGDVILRAGAVHYPRASQLRAEAAARRGEHLALLVLRDEMRVPVEADVDRNGRIGVGIDWLESRPLIAVPVLETLRRSASGRREPHPTPVAALHVPAGSTILSVAGRPVADWPAFLAALRRTTKGAYVAADGGTAVVAVQPPAVPAGADDRPGAAAAPLTVDLRLDADEVRALHTLGWQSDLDAGFFDPIYVTVSAGGSPLTAVRMGFEETHKMIVMTYLTIDRLIRGSVGVKQLRGPVGIIDLGTKILPKGFMYFIFFLGMISVNLAVLNFLPLPIVDGGLFLFLVYEKIKGRPPSVRFQNAATLVGLFLIGTVFIVTFYNDIARLLG